MRRLSDRPADVLYPDIGHNLDVMRRLIVVVLVLAACSTEPAPDEQPTPSTTTTTARQSSTTTTTRPPFDVSSPAFADGEEIPREFTCDGADMSPRLDVVGIPSSAESLVVIVEDPDAPLGTWYHWVEFDIDPESGARDILRDTGPIGIQGANSWNLTGYRGPCPPEGEEHRYVFKVFALEERLDLPEGVDAPQVYTAMEGRVISTTELTGTYAR